MTGSQTCLIDIFYRLDTSLFVKLNIAFGKVAIVNDGSCNRYPFRRYRLYNHNPTAISMKTEDNNAIAGENFPDFGYCRVQNLFQIQRLVNSLSDRSHQLLPEKLLLQCFFCLLAIGDVHRHTHHMYRCACLVTIYLTFVPYPVQATVRPDDSKFNSVICTFFNGTSHGANNGFTVFRMDAMEKGFIG